VGRYRSSSNNQENIDLKDVSSVAELSFSTKYETETNYDFAYIWANGNQSGWDLCLIHWNTIRMDQ